MRRAVIHDTWLPVTRDTFTVTRSFHRPWYVSRDKISDAFLSAGSLTPFTDGISRAECNWSRRTDDYLQALSRVLVKIRARCLRIISTTNPAVAICDETCFWFGDRYIFLVIQRESCTQRNTSNAVFPNLRVHTLVGSHQPYHSITLC